MHLLSGLTEVFYQFVIIKAVQMVFIVFNLLQGQIHVQKMSTLVLIPLRMVVGSVVKSCLHLTKLSIAHTLTEIGGTTGVDASHKLLWHVRCFNAGY